MSRTLESSLIFLAISLGSWALMDAAWCLMQMLNGR